MKISKELAIPDSEIKIEAVRSGGPGGQNVNKVSSAVHLRFDIHASSLPDEYKQRLLRARDRRVSRSGVLVIKAQRFRSREMNREDALERLREFILRGIPERNRRRIVSRPTRASVRKRLDSKRRRGRIKALRRKVIP